MSEDRCKGRLEGLNYALGIVRGRRILNHHPAYLAAVEEVEIFLMASVERVKSGEEMYSVSICQDALED